MSRDLCKPPSDDLFFFWKWPLTWHKERLITFLSNANKLFFEILSFLNIIQNLHDLGSLTIEQSDFIPLDKNCREYPSQESRLVVDFNEHVFEQREWSVRRLRSVIMGLDVSFYNFVEFVHCSLKVFWWHGWRDRRHLWPEQFEESGEMMRQYACMSWRLLMMREGWKLWRVKSRVIEVQHRCLASLFRDWFMGCSQWNQGITGANMCYHAMLSWRNLLPHEILFYL